MLELFFIYTIALLAGSLENQTNQTTMVNQTQTNTTDIIDALAQQRLDKLLLDVEVEKVYRQKLIDQLEKKCLEIPENTELHSLVCKSIPRE